MVFDLLVARVHFWFESGATSDSQWSGGHQEYREFKLRGKRRMRIKTLSHAASRKAWHKHKSYNSLRICLYLRDDFSFAFEDNGIRVAESVLDALDHAHSRFLFVLEGAESEGHEGEALVHLREEDSGSLELQLVDDVALLEHRRPGVFLATFSFAFGGNDSRPG